MIRLRTLGEISLTAGDGREARSVLAQPKRLALLAYLASPHTPESISRETLLGLFWPESDQERARSALRSSLYFLRRSLGPEVLVPRAEHEVGIDPDRLVCDATGFENALQEGDPEGAVRLYGGEYLAGLVVEGASGFERWLEAERRHYRRRAVKAAVDAARAFAAAGAPAKAEDWARRALRLDPWDEAALRLLMQILARQGRRAEALRSYERFADRVRAELRLEPSPQTVNLSEELRRGEPSEGGELVARGEGPGISAEEPGRGGEEDSSADPARAVRAHGPAAGAGRPRRPRLLAAGALAGALLLVGTAVVWRASPHGTSAGIHDSPGAGGPEMGEATPPLARDGFLALPFRDAAGLARLDPVAAAAADRVAKALTETGIVHATSAPRSRNGPGSGGPAGDSTSVSPQAVALAREAGDRYLVVGTWGRVGGDSVVLRARIADASTGRVVRRVHTRPVVRTAAGEAEADLERRLTGAIGTILDSRFDPWVREASLPPDFGAYLAYSAGLELFFGGREDSAAVVLRQVADPDSGFTSPLLWAVYAYFDTHQRERADSLLSLLERRREDLAPWDRNALHYFRFLRTTGYDAAYGASRPLLAGAPPRHWLYSPVFVLMYDWPDYSIEVDGVGPFQGDIWSDGGTYPATLAITRVDTLGRLSLALGAHGVAGRCLHVRLRVISGRAPRAGCEDATLFTNTRSAEVGSQEGFTNLATPGDTAHQGGSVRWADGEGGMWIVLLDPPERFLQECAAAGINTVGLSPRGRGVLIRLLRVDPDSTRHWEVTTEPENGQMRAVLRHLTGGGERCEAALRFAFRLEVSG